MSAQINRVSIPWPSNVPNCDPLAAKRIRDRLDTYPKRIEAAHNRVAEARYLQNESLVLARVRETDYLLSEYHNTENMLRPHSV